MKLKLQTKNNFLPVFNKKRMQIFTYWIVFSFLLLLKLIKYDLLSTFLWNWLDQKSEHRKLNYLTPTGDDIYICVCVCVRACMRVKNEFVFLRCHVLFKFIFFFKWSEHLSQYFSFFAYLTFVRYFSSNGAWK